MLNFENYKKKFLNILYLLLFLNLTLWAYLSICIGAKFAVVRQ